MISGRVFKAAYPDLHENKKEIGAATVVEMTEKITACIVNPAYFSPSFPGQSNLSLSYWSHLKECIDYTESAIYECTHSVWYMCWNFVYVVHNEGQRRCLALFGGASD